MDAAIDMNAFSAKQADAENETGAYEQVGAAEEQAWNATSLAATVSLPRIGLWTYRSAAVVLGVSQHHMADRLRPAAQGLGLEFVVRAAGGGAVLAGPWMLSASVVLPHEHRLVRAGPVESYQWLGHAYVDVLKTLGVPARALAPDAARQLQGQSGRDKLGWSCFAGLSPWEVVVGQRKIAGLAQVRKRTGVLLVAGLLVDRPDWKLLCRAMERPEQEADSHVCLTTSCSEQLGTAPSREELAVRLRDAIGQAI